MVKRRVNAIISDYDGTLVPAANVRNAKATGIPTELKEILGNISAEIPISIISTKDFEFLAQKVTFARVLSCIMGIETLVLTTHASSRMIEKRILRADLATLEMNSKVLEAIAEEILSCEDFSDMLVERKYTSDRILAGLTIDWRHHRGENWFHFRRGIAHFISSMVANLRKPPVPIDIYVQKYSEHPFVDIYSIECNKGIAFDTVISECVTYSSAHAKGTLYLGDSENDNPAFRKAGISIGIRSDARIKPKLDCKYFLDYEQLSSFLEKLKNNDYLFSEELLRGQTHTNKLRTEWDDTKLSESS
jgi:hydroxymethylpyrimidine pyrophosphatase-like HAD family hydrolase